MIIVYPHRNEILANASYTSHEISVFVVVLTLNLLATVASFPLTLFCFLTSLCHPPSNWHLYNHHHVDCQELDTSHILLGLSEKVQFDF